MAKKAKSAGSGGGFKDLLLKKGEKFALFAALGITGLFFIWGIVSATSAADAKKTTADLKMQSDRINRAINDPNGEPTPLPQSLRAGGNGGDLPHVTPDMFPIVQSFYEPVAWPSVRRENPRVLAAIEGQINYFQGAVKIFDRQFVMSKNGEIESVKMGLIDKPVKSKEVDLALMAKINKNVRSLAGQSGPRRQSPLSPPGSGSPGGMLPGGMMPGSGGEGYPGAGPGGNYDPNSSRGDRIVVHKSYEEAMKSQLQPALTVKPLRMAVVQLSFPLKAQLEEIKRALRLRNLMEAQMESGPTGAGGGFPGGMPPGGMPPGGFRPGGSPATGPLPGFPGPGGPGFPMPGGSPGPGGPGAGGLGSQFAAGVAPVFEGIEVQRRLIPPAHIPTNGKPPEWQDLDHEGQFWMDFVRYEAPFVQESGLLPYFLRPEQRLACPLPIIADGLDPNYPPNVQLMSIYKNAEELKKRSIGPKAADEMRNRFQQGSNNPYAPSAYGSVGKGMIPGYDGGGEGMKGPDIMPGMPNRPRGPGSGGEDEENQPMLQPNDPNKLDIDYLLLRFVDTDLKPGYTYEYQVRVKMRNPNYGRKELVARDTDAKIKELTGEWFVVPEKLTVPYESFLYAGDATEFEKKVKELTDATDSKQLPIINEINEINSGKRAVVQLQQWYQQVVLPGGKSEPVGSWIVVDIPVTPGEYIGRKTYLQLPLWSAGVGNYTFRSLSDELKKTLGFSKTPQDSSNGYFVQDFRTKNLLIDFNGGKSRESIGGRQITDEAASELLILREDGKIEVRSELADAALKDRQEREVLWTKWLSDVKARKDQYLGENPMGGPGGGRTDGGRTGP